MKDPKDIKEVVKKKYEEIASQSSHCGCGCSCGQKTAKSIGYSDEDLAIAGNANLGLGCGNPVALSKIKEGDVVVDLGSGAGIDCLLAAQRVGEKGRVIGVDMSEAMIAKAKANAKDRGYTNIDFILGEIEKLPLEDRSVDVIITNCVINLTPNKEKAFKEAYRVLKNGGKMYLSDIVLLEDLSDEQKNDDDLLSGCVAGALLKDDYLDKLKNAGFKLHILNENKNISKEQYNGIALESLSIEAEK